jgi:hypothetical protein
LLRHARELQKRPAFAEVRRRRQVVEHRIARLVQLDIRQARYVGRIKTLFQVCLAAAVANLSLMAATATTSSATAEHLIGQALLLLSVILSLNSLLSAFESDTFTIGHLFMPTAPSVPWLAAIRPELPPCRPAF